MGILWGKRTLPIGGTLKETVFLKRANWAVSSFPNAPLLFLDRRSRVAAFDFPQAEFPAQRLGRLGWAGTVAVAFWARPAGPRAGPAAEAVEQL